jgi:hypothetical protein
VDAQDLLTKPISAIALQDRLRLISSLLDGSPIRHIEASRDLGMMVLTSDEPTRPRVHHVIRQRSYFTFRPTRLVILDQTQEFIETETTERDTSDDQSGWLTRTKETRQTRRLVAVPVSAWRVHELYFGSLCGLRVANGSGPIPGAAFASGYKLDRKQTVPAGVDVSIGVSHALENPAPFYALLFGIPVK